jgi:hypothetical protein
MRREQRAQHVVDGAVTVVDGDRDRTRGQCNRIATLPAHDVGERHDPVAVRVDRLQLVAQRVDAHRHRIDARRREPVVGQD